jgi:hypothetical protein
VTAVAPQRQQRSGLLARDVATRLLARIEGCHQSFPEGALKPSKLLTM